MSKFFKISQLDEEQVAQVRVLESQLGKHVMAFAPGLQIAALDADDLARVKELEERLGVTLLVFEPTPAAAA